MDHYREESRQIMRIIGLQKFGGRKSGSGQFPGRDAALRRPGRRSAPTLPKPDLRPNSASLGFLAGAPPVIASI
jgi:hypothetical protein